MAWFIPAIMALGHGAAAAGAAGSAGAAGGAAAGAGAAGAAGAGTAAGAGLAGAGAGAAGTAAGSAGTAAGGAAAGAAMPAVGSVAAKAPSLMDKADAFMKHPTVTAAKDSLNSMLMGANKSSAVPDEQHGESVQNPISQSPSFPGGDSAMPQALMPGAMDIPFGAPSQRVLNDTLLRNGG